jgi:predicted nucleotidyltransferase component of viral defense system
METDIKECCPLCDRELGQYWDEHHLIPKSKRGKEKHKVHVICHRKVHSLFSENELRDYYNTWAALKSNPDMQKFIAWVRKRPINYVDSSRRAK